MRSVCRQAAGVVEGSQAAGEDALSINYVRLAGIMRIAVSFVQDTSITVGGTDSSSFKAILRANFGRRDTDLCPIPKSTAL